MKLTTDEIRSELLEGGAASGRSDATDPHPMVKFFMPGCECDLAPHGA
jgi:hypothetical protein